MDKVKKQLTNIIIAKQFATTMRNNRDEMDTKEDISGILITNALKEISIRKIY